MTFGDDVIDDIPTEDAYQDDRGQQSPPAPLATLQLRRPTRECQPSRRYPTSEHIMLTYISEPESYYKAQTYELKEDCEKLCRRR